MSFQDAFPEFFGQCTRLHDNVDGEFVEFDENGDQTYECPVCQDQWTEYK